MSLQIESLKENVSKLWDETRAGEGVRSAGYSTGQQTQREAEVELLMESTDRSVSEFQKIPRSQKKRLRVVRSRIQKSIVQLLHSFDCVIDDDMEGSFTGVTDDFIQRAYEFDRTINEDAVYQAARNVLIMNTLQMHLGREVKLTPSVFAYSMLYPYTDNYLDSIEIGRLEKQEANMRLQLRLAGIRTPPRNRREEMINRLVGMIEGEFDRGRYPLVYDSLLGIHSAQCRSVEQQSGDRELPLAELLDISIEKGGTSVLADGCLVAGDAGREDLEFFFHFGVLLQLIDDLQDMQEDLLHNQWTMVGSMAQTGTIDEYTNRLLAFITTVLDSVPFKQERLRRLIERSCRLLVLEAAACNPFNYSGQYLLALEHQSPVQFEYLRAVKKRLRETYNDRPARPAYVLGWVG